MTDWAPGNIIGACLLVLIVVPGLSACGDHHESLSKRVKDSTAAEEPEATTAEIQQHWANRDTQVVSSYEGEPFYVNKRSSSIEKYPCKNCHTESFKLRDNAEIPKRAHWEIDVDHGATGHSEDFECATCHDPSNPDSLRGPAGDTYSIDESHKACGSCHQQQLVDWAGGAHGKRYDYWQGSRVIYTCAECHNPHDPGIEKRWPVTYPSIPRKSKGADQ